MNIILLDKVKNLGSMGDTVSVRPGYGRNYLIPQGKAVPANKENIARFETQRAEISTKVAKTLAAAQSRVEKLNDVSVEISSKASDEGKLYGSVSARDIAVAISTAAGLEVAKHEVQIVAGPIRNIGDYDIILTLHADVSATINLKVVPAA